MMKRKCNITVPRSALFLLVIAFTLLLACPQKLIPLQFLSLDGKNETNEFVWKNDDLKVKIIGHGGLKALIEYQVYIQIQIEYDASDTTLRFDPDALSVRFDNKTMMKVNIAGQDHHHIETKKGKYQIGDHFYTPINLDSLSLNRLSPYFIDIELDGFLKHDEYPIRIDPIRARDPLLEKWLGRH